MMHRGFPMSSVRRRSTGGGPITLSGVLSRTGVTSTITGTTRTATVPEGNSGDIRFNNLTLNGVTAMQYSKNVGAFTTITEDLVVNLADTNTLAIRATGCAAGEDGQVEVLNNDDASIIESVMIDYPL